MSSLSALEEKPPHPAAFRRSGAWRRFGSHLLLAYVLLYLLSLFAAPLWAPLVMWVGRHVFRANPVLTFTGSGDTEFDYVKAACCVALAFLAASAWTALSQGRADDARLNEWMRIAVRFTLALNMIGYSAVKLIPSQFPAPSLVALAEPLGEHSPMGLLWAFMGASPAYNVFAGMAEMTGGLLLLSRRTTLLGALLCMATMGNVVALNFCYDVPVKLFSTHLLAMAVLLAAPDLRRLADLFLWNRPSPPVILRPHSARRWVNRTLLGVKAVLFLGAALVSLFQALGTRRMYAPSGPRPPLYGVWNADPPAPGKSPDARHWRQAVFEHPGLVSIRTADGTRRPYRLAVDRADGALTLTTLYGPAQVSHLAYSQPQPDRLTLRGEVGGLPIQATLTRAPETKPLLLGRGFHWISPVPFNQ